MLFPCGWPKSYFAFPANYGHDEIISCLPHAPSPVFAFPTTFLASKRAVQLWAATDNPFKIGQLFIPPQELLRVGPQVAAEWNAYLSSALSLTSKGWAILYILTPTQQKLHRRPNASGPLRDATTVHITIQATVQLFGNSIGNCLVPMGSAVLVGTGDGMLQMYNWQKMVSGFKAQEMYEFSDEEMPEWFEGYLDLLSLESNGDSNEQSSSPLFPNTPEFHSGNKMSKGAIVDLHYSSRVHRLAVTFEDGSTGLCHTDISSLSSLHINQWINEGAESFKVTCARIGDCANMVAVGCTDGTVTLFRLSESVSIFGEQTEESRTPVPSPVRRLNLSDWGHGPDITGPVQDICWSGDCTAFAVGFRQRGIVVWTPSGCRLMCSLPQTPLKPKTALLPRKSAIKARNTDRLSLSGHSTEEFKMEALLNSINCTAAVESDMPTLEWGVSVLSWGVDGYRLWVGQTGRAREIWQLRFVRALSGRHRVSHPSEKSGEKAERELEEVYVLQGDDRLLLISELPTSVTVDMDSCLLDGRFSESQLTARHILAPQEYIAENWPIKLATVSPDGADIAIAGIHGLALYARRTEKWRLFGDVSEERSISASLINWLDRIIVICSTVTDGMSELLLFPHFHLSFESLLLRHPIPETPVALDCLDRYILIASEPLNIILFECVIDGELSRSTKSKAVLTPLRELTILSLERPLFNVSLTKTVHHSSAVPDQCVVLRWGGVLTLLDMEKGVEQFLANEVECFWLSEAAKVPAHQPTAASYILPSFAMESEPLSGSQQRQEVRMVEMPWWAYGVRGMELWFPSSLTDPLSPRRITSAGNVITGQLDPELEFDREVYPVGISLADAAIIGVSQRLVRPPSDINGDGSPSLSLPCFSPMPDTQPVLPCLLRRLLQRGAVQEARLLAKKHQKVGLHFSKSLEWLLFTALEFEATTSSSTVGKNAATSRPGRGRESLLTLATSLVKDFPQFPDVVVSVARKTDAQLWPLLFNAVGRPSEILDTLLNQGPTHVPLSLDCSREMAAGASHSAACLLVVIDKMEGGVLARALALQVLQIALTSGEYNLVAELLRYAVTQSDFDLMFTKAPSATPPVEKQSGIGAWLSWLWGGTEEEPSHPQSDNSEHAIISGASHEAAKMVREHVWCLLEYSQLQCLLALAHSVSSMGGGLPALMGGHSPGDEFMADKMTEAFISSSMMKLHLQPSSEAFHSDAELLLEISQHARCDTWSLVLALLLRHTPVIVSFRLKHPGLWSKIYQAFSTESVFEPYFQLMKELEQSAVRDNEMAAPPLHE